MSCSRLDLYTFVEILDGWFSDLAMPGIFKGPAHKPTTARPPRALDKLTLKEAKWGKYKNEKVQRLAALEQGGWTVAYTDGSAKTVRVWAQAGFGVWFHRGSPRNHSAHVPISKRQSVSRGGLRGVLHAVLARRPGERLAVVMDSEYVFKGIMEWSPKWRRHGWRASSGEVGHRDLWETILWERERAGDELQIHWIPSHLGVQGNEEAGALAEAGRLSHPDNYPRDHGWNRCGRIWGWKRCRRRFPAHRDQSSRLRQCRRRRTWRLRLPRVRDRKGGARRQASARMSALTPRGAEAESAPDRREGEQHNLWRRLRRRICERSVAAVSPPY